MNAVAQSKQTPILALLAVFALANAVDFIFYGQQLYHLAALIGLSVTAFGTVKHQKFITTCGAVMAIAATAAKYV